MNARNSNSAYRLAAVLPIVVATAVPGFAGLPAASISRPAVRSPLSDDPSVAPVTDSRLLKIHLPDGAMRFQSSESADKIAGPLQEIARAGKISYDATTTEGLIWTGKNYSREKGKSIQNTVLQTLKQGGWNYVSAGEKDTADGHVTIFMIGKNGAKKATLGLWLLRDDAVLLGWGTCAPATNGLEPQSGKNSEETREREPATEPTAAEPPARASNQSAGQGVIVTVGPTTRAVNVMKGINPHMPTFPKLSPKPRFVRGYVYDTNGKPLAGARIGVRSTSAGGFYSGASAKSDARGYYEIEVPWGVAHFYTAGYSVDYGDGRAALSLCPSDGEADQFASATGLVENWVLVPYGIADRDATQDNPQYGNNYFGANLVVSYHLGEDNSVPANSEIELTLVPDGPLIDGSKGRTITIRKNVGSLIFDQLYLNNIPAGSYRFTARLTGKPLKMKEIGPSANQSFGLEPKEGTGNVHLLFRPNTAKADMTAAGHGSWDQVCVEIERP